MTHVCSVCETPKAAEAFPRTRAGKGRSRVCASCVAALAAQPQVTPAGESLCATCGHYHAPEAFSPVALHTCKRCVHGALHGGRGTPSAFVLELQRARLGAVLSPVGQIGLDWLLSQVGELRQRLQQAEVDRDYQTQLSTKLQVDLRAARAENERLAADTVGLTLELGRLEGRVTELEGELAQARTLTRVVPQAPRPAPSTTHGALLDRLALLPNVVGEAALIVAMEAMAAGHSEAEVIHWIDDGMSKLKKEVVDPLEQSWVLKTIFECHMRPKSRGDLIAGVYGFGDNTYKARSHKKVRVYYRRDGDKATILEVCRRDHAYANNTIKGRQKKAS